MQETLIDQGVNLMLFGMSTVFVFLTILVFATTVMSKLVSRFASEESSSAAAVESPSSSPNANGQPAPNIVSAIQKAIAAHRQR